MKLHCQDMGYSVAELSRDAETASQGWDWAQGAYGHTLSLPSSQDLDPRGRNNSSNLPFSGALGRCPAFRAVLDGFECAKSSFRLLRRRGRTSYGWHHDRDKGPGVVRMQIPIVDEQGSELVVTDYDSFEQIRGGKRRIQDLDYFESFQRKNAGHFRIFRLQTGLLYYFNTNKLHDLLNRGTGDRLTLSIDLVVNDWVLDRFPATREELEGTLARPEPGRRRTR